MPDLVGPLRKHILVVRVGRGTQQKQNCVFDRQPGNNREEGEAGILQFLQKHVPLT